MVFQPIQTKKIYQEVLSQIESLIQQGILKPGDKLMGEREMSQTLKVSRTSVREAIRTLEILGLVEIRLGEGTFLRENSLDSIINPMALSLSITAESVQDMFEVRKILEIECAGLAALRHNDEEIKLMESTLKDMQENIENEQVGLKADLRLHFQIAQASKNAVLYKLMHVFAEVLHDTVQSTRRNRFSKCATPDKLIDEHKEIINAIKIRDYDLAKNLMKDHLGSVQF
ncbi:MAG: FadR/GntR family transcriptional regulator [Bacillota bacterium]|nr:FadR/GntR family transcriptional regulator [Bacillota bacterium]